MIKCPDDLTGAKFGALTVVRRAPGHENENTLWLCRCDCGMENCKGTVIVRRGNLTRKADWVITCGAQGNNADQTAKTKFERGVVQKNSKTGITGVNSSSLYPGKYRARMCISKKKRLVVDNLSFREAVVARKAWESMLVALGGK
uniref:Post-SET domain-containing protein n=1 Tax=Dulem virus 33 TaxID=3145751 RepID=A0AAU8B5K3_9CAUD